MDAGGEEETRAAAAALLQAAGTGWLHGYVSSAPPEEDDMATLRARIGETAFEQARAQGAAMGRKDAVEHALAESARAPTRGRETVS